MADFQLGIKITADGKNARAELTSVQNALSGVENTSKKASNRLADARQRMDEAARSAGLLVGSLAGLSAAGALTYIVKTAAEFDRLNASLRTVTGGARQAQAAMDMIKSFAKTTPYEVEEVTTAFIRLKALGLDASEEALRSYGNTAGAMGKTMLQFIEAVADASTNEFERLKEFGIKARQQGDQVTFTFRGVSTTVQKTSEDITKYLRSIGDVQFAGGMAQQMDTLGGKLSNLKDAFASLADTIARKGIDSALKRMMDNATTIVTDFQTKIAGVTDNKSAASAYTDRYKEMARVLDQMQSIRTLPGGSLLISDEDVRKQEEALASLDAAIHQLRISAEQDAAAAAKALATGMDAADSSLSDVGKTADATKKAIASMAQESKAGAAVMLALAKHESEFRQYQKDGSILYGRDRAGNQTTATGIFQIINKTADGIKRVHTELGKLDSKAPVDNIKLAIALVDDLIKKYGDLDTALAAYYVGEPVIDKMISKRGVPDFNYAPPNQQPIKNYIAAIKRDIDQFQNEYPGGVLPDPAVAERYAKAGQALFQNAIKLSEAQLSASVAKQKAELDRQIAELEAKARQAAADAALAINGLTGSKKTDAVRSQADAEKAAAQEIAALKYQQLALDQRVVQAHLDGISKTIAAQEQLQLTEADMNGLLQEKASTEAQLAQLASRRAEEEISAGEKLSDAQRKVAAAMGEQLKAEQDADDARRGYLTSLDDEIARLSDRNTQVEEYRKVVELSKGATEEAAKAFADEADKRLKKLKELRNAQEEQKKAEQSVADEQLRMANYFSTMVDQARSAAQLMAETFGETGKSIGAMFTSIAENAQYSYQIQAKLAEDLKKATTDDQRDKLTSEAYTKELGAQFQMYGQLTRAASGFFEKGSQGYNTLQRAAQAFSVAQMAMTAAETIAKGIEAIVNQASTGDPYTAIPRMAMMAAALASIGVAVSAPSGGTGAVATSKRMQGKNQGTVFGDREAESESISKALEIVAKNSSTDLAYSAGMLRSLKNIEAAMGGVVNSVIRNVTATSALEGKNVKLGSGPAFSAMQKAMMGMDMLLGDMLWRTTKKITDWGIGAFPQTIEDIITKGFQGKTFTDVTTTTKFLFMDVSSSVKTYIGDMADETERQFTLAIRSIADGVKIAGQAFGVSADEFLKKVGGFQVKFDTTSLKGLKGEELEKAVQAQFSKIADQIASAMDIRGLDEFQRVGEGTFETLIRVAEGLTRANEELKTLGIEAVKYSEIINKQGDVAAEIVRQSIVLFEGATSGIGQFINEAVGSAEDLISTYRDLLESRDILKGLGLQFDTLNRTMTQAAGGVSSFLDSLKSFRDEFYNQGEQYSTLVVGLAREFGNLGLALPQSREEFRQLAESIDTTTVEGAELFARIISLSDAFAQAADRADALEKKYQSYTDPFATFTDQIDKVVSDFEEIIAGKLANIEARFASEASLLKRETNAPYQGSLDLTNSRKSSLQSEIAQTMGYLNQTTGEITRLQDLIARWEGVPKAAAYVAQWRTQLSAMQDQANVLVRDLDGKNKELGELNRKIADLEAQIAQNNADIDTAQLSDKLRALNAERSRIMREEGDAIVRTFKEIWDQIVGVIDDARDSLQRQIAELTGPRAVAKFTLTQQRESLQDLRQYQRSGGNDPEKLVSLVTAAQSAIMDRYNARLEVLTRQMDRNIKEQAKPIRQAAREKIQTINAKLRVDTREINKQLRIDTRAVQQDANRRIRAIEVAGAAAIEAYRAQVSAQVDAINDAMDAALQALEDRQQAEQDALQDAQDARMEALQDEQQEATKLLQKRHSVEMKALQDQLSSAQQLQQSFKQIAEFSRSIKLGDLSSLSPEDQLKEALSQYSDVLAKAQGGDADAASQYTSISQTLLQLAKQYFGGNEQFDAIYKRIVSDSEKLGSTTVDMDPVEAAIEALQESQERQLEELQKAQQVESRALQKVFRDESRALSRAQQDQADAIRDSYQKQIDAVQKGASKVEEQMRAQTDRQVQKIENQTQRQIDKLENVAQRQINQLERQAQRQIDKIENQTQRLIDRLRDPETSARIRELKDSTIAKLERLDDVLVYARQQAANKADQQIQYLSSLNLLNQRQLTQLNKIGRALGGGTTPVPAFAAGGVMKPGPAIVAEKGIEPIWFDKGGRVLSNAEAKASLSDGDRKIAKEIAELKEQIATLTRAQIAANSRMVPAVESLAEETAAARRDAKIRPRV